jgi:ANTAR domain
LTERVVVRAADRPDVAGETAQREDEDTSEDGIVLRRSGQGWQVGPEQLADLTSAMVLADLLAADLGPPPPRPAAPLNEGDAPASDAGESDADASDAGESDADQAARLAVTVAQLEHALAARVRVEQSIGVLAERHRLAPRQAFDLLRQAARSRGQKVVEIAEAVVNSASNPLLPLPEELARQQRPARRRGPSPRHVRAGQNVSEPR